MNQHLCTALLVKPEQYGLVLYIVINQRHPLLSYGCRLSVDLLCRWKWRSLDTWQDKVEWLEQMVQTALAAAVEVEQQPSCAKPQPECCNSVL